MPTNLGFLSCCGCQHTDGVGVKIHNGASFGAGGSEFPVKASHARCFRLLVWKNRTISGGAFSGSGTPDHVLMTNGTGNGYGTDGRFEMGGSHSGVDLDGEPYWWPLCPIELGGAPRGIGGWQEDAQLYIPTLASGYSALTGIGGLPTDINYNLFAMIKNSGYRILKNGSSNPEASRNCYVAYWILNQVMS